MSLSFDQMLESLGKLTAAERAELAHCLIASLDEPAEPDVESAWLDLAERRLREIRSGKVEAVSWEEIKERIRR